MFLVMTAFDALFAAARVAWLLDVGPWRWDRTRPIWAHFQFNYLGNLAAYLTFPKRLVAYFWHDLLLDNYLDDFFPSERVWLCGVSLKHLLSVGLAWRRQFGFSGVGRVIFSVPKARVGYMLTQPRLTGLHRARNHVNHNAGFASDDFYVFTGASNIRME